MAGSLVLGVIIFSVVKAPDTGLPDQLCDHHSKPSDFCARIRADLIEGELKHSSQPTYRLR